MAKALTIRCRDADQPDGGFAILTIAPIADYRGDGRFIVRRFDRPEQFLGRHGWQVAEASMKPRDMQMSGGQLTMTVGPEMVDYMETGLSVQLQLVDGGQLGALAWPDVAPSILRGSDQRNIAGKQVVAGDPLSRQMRDAANRHRPPEPPPTPQPSTLAPSQALSGTDRPVPRPTGNEAKTVVVRGPNLGKAPEEPVTVKGPARHVDVTPSHKTTAKSGGGGVLTAIGVGIVAALILGGGAWVYITCPDWAPICSALQPTPSASDVPPATPACSADRLIREASTRPLEDVFRDAMACQKRNEWSVAIGALQIAVSRGHGPSANAMGALYDPASFRPGGYLSQADPYEAARYYRLAIDLGDNSAAPARETLRQYLVQQAAQGSTAAKLALQNYW